MKLQGAFIKAGELLKENIELEMKDLSFAEYQEEYKEDFRFLFGFHNGNGSKYQHQAKDYMEYVVLVYAEKLIPLALANDYKSFLRSSFCKTNIELDYVNETLIVPAFFKENKIEIMPIYRKNMKKITKKEFLKVANKKGIKELKYITFDGSGNAKSEYKWLLKNEIFCL